MEEAGIAVAVQELGIFMGVRMVQLDIVAVHQASGRCWDCYKSGVWTGAVVLG